MGVVAPRPQYLAGRCGRGEPGLQGGRVALHLGIGRARRHHLFMQQPIAIHIRRQALQPQPALRVADHFPLQCGQPWAGPWPGSRARPEQLGEVLGPVWQVCPGTQFGPVACQLLEKVRQLLGWPGFHPPQRVQQLAHAPVAGRAPVDGGGLGPVVAIGQQWAGETGVEQARQRHLSKIRRRVAQQSFGLRLKVAGGDHQLPRGLEGIPGYRPHPLHTALTVDVEGQIDNGPIQARLLGHSQNLLHRLEPVGKLVVQQPQGQ